MIRKMRGTDFNNTKTTRTDFNIPKMIMVMTAILFGVALVMSFFMLRPSKNHQVEIVQDGRVLYVIDLDSAKDQTIVLHYEKGSSNTIFIREGQIWVSEAECPDQTCVKMGKLRSDHLPIVCMPNRLIIRFCEEDGR